MTIYQYCQVCGSPVDAFSLARHKCVPRETGSVDDLVYRLEKRAEIRRQIPGRKSVENNEPDRIADLLEEAAKKIKLLDRDYRFMKDLAIGSEDVIKKQSDEIEMLKKNLFAVQNASIDLAKQLDKK